LNKHWRGRDSVRNKQSNHHADYTDARAHSVGGWLLPVNEVIVRRRRGEVCCRDAVAAKIMPALAAVSSALCFIPYSL